MAGTVASTVQVRVWVAVLPTGSVAVTTRVCGPSASPAADHEVDVHGLVTPSSSQTTVASPSVVIAMLASALRTSPDGAPLRDSAGGVLSTVQVRVSVVVLPAGSVAVTTTVCGPSPRPETDQALWLQGLPAPSSYR